MSLVTEDLETVARRARVEAEAAGELRPSHIGPVQSALPERVRVAVADDLASGAYQRAAREAVAGDPDLAQG